MRLTHIKLAGFKSFTDPTTIHVPGKLVAVIGPNGCGKSNVIDAVRWVLGEASAKQLRGESMQDVIFNGAATRRPAPRASVELVFDNSDHSLQGAWGQYAEVSIKRQLTRQGDSTYFINNQIVRRRDITDLFLGTGVGARGYAVIEQGMISRIIEARPEELRAYIEEAAGVSKYKERRKETESRLKDTREHLQRLADLQSELSRQVEKLEKQAQTAARYSMLTEQLAQQQDLLDFVQWKNALEQADHATEQHQLSLQRQNETAEQSQQLNEQIHQLRETEQEQQAYAQNLNNQRAILREQMARLEEQLRSQHNLQQRIERDRLNAQAQLQRIAQETQNLQEELAQIALENEEKQIELAEWAVQVAEREERLPELEEAQNEFNNAFQAQQDELNRLKRELALKQQQLSHIKHTQNQHSQRQGRLSAEAQALNLPSENELQKAQETAEILQNEHDIFNEQFVQNEENISQLKKQLAESEQQYQTIYQEVITTQAQHQAIATLLQSEDNDFWANTEHARAPELWQHLNAPDEWRHALAVVLAGRLNARFVGHAFMPSEPLPDGAAAWLTTPLPVSKKIQPVQALIHQIHTDERFQTALSYWLDGVLCAPNLAYALAHQGDLQGNQSWLTQEGHQVDRAGVVLFHQNESNNLIERKAQFDRLNEHLQILQPQLQQMEQMRGKWRQELNQQEEKLKTHLAQQRAHASQLQAAQARATELLTQTNQGQLRREHIEQELWQIEEELLVLQQSSDGMEDDIVALTEAVTSIEIQQNQLSNHKQQQQNQVQQARLALLEANRQYGMIEVASHKLQQRAQNTQQQLAVLEQQKFDWQERQSELALSFENEQNGEQREQLETLSEQVLNLDEQIIVAQDTLNATQQHGRDLYAKQQMLNATLPQLQATTQTALLQQQEALLNAKRFHDNLTAREADFDELENLAKQSDNLKKLSDGIGSLAEQIQALGAVNLAALQELEEAKERDSYYQNQSQDVQSAIDLLEEAIAQIDGETKTRFKETFDAVNDKVQTFFPTLFGGGEATLHMIGDDLLNAGVSIMARPPGKKNSTIHLLSGGEKALTAMSLVFALFSLNPAPFCLLDEVDAPLDDANTSRFCQLVKEMSAQTQFLYISHNRLTMEMAEQLIGVTMQEKGVSRVVAVDIQQALQMAEN